MDIEKAKKQFELVKDTETFVITTVTFKSLLEEIENLQADLKQANALLQWEEDYSEKKHLKNIELAEKVEFLGQQIVKSNEKTGLLEREIEELKDELFEAYRMQLKGMVVGGQLDWIRNRMLELEE
jgi:hypothetical protein